MGDRQGTRQTRARRSRRRLRRRNRRRKTRSSGSAGLAEGGAMNFEIGDFTSSDAEAVNRVALSAFQQYQNEYYYWGALSSRIGNIAGLAEFGELVVAKVEGEVAGAVAYVGPGKAKAAFFAPEWPILRMLVVDPA